MQYWLCRIFHLRELYSWKSRCQDSHCVDGTQSDLAENWERKTIPANSSSNPSRGIYCVIPILFHGPLLCLMQGVSTICIRVLGSPLPCCLHIGWELADTSARPCFLCFHVLLETQEDAETSISSKEVQFCCLRQKLHFKHLLRPVNILKSFWVEIIALHKCLIHTEAAFKALINAYIPPEYV